MASEAITRIDKPYRLSRLDSEFLLEYCNNGGNATKAYRTIRPEVDESACGIYGCRILKRIRTRATWSDLLKASGLDDTKLVSKMTELLEADKVIPTKDGAITVSDNAIRQRALELLSDWHGKTKTEIKVGLTYQIIPRVKSAGSNG
jgi:hypothetical protein